MGHPLRFSSSVVLPVRMMDRDQFSLRRLAAGPQINISPLKSIRGELGLSEAPPSRRYTIPWLTGDWWAARMEAPTHVRAPLNGFYPFERRASQVLMFLSVLVPQV